MAKPKKRAETFNGGSRLKSDLRMVTNLLALLVVKGETREEKIRILAAVGYAPTYIAELLGTTANTVSVTLHKIRSSKKK